LGRDARAATTTDADAGIDYDVERFASFGVGADGRKYRLDAARLEHYPADGGARLHRPRIVQYDLTGATRRIRADSGWLRNDGAEAILTGNVHVHENAAAASVARSQRMLIRLK
ncbi:MAG: LPS export ABC transporter periplasmic protein LptC, partial [bacterium]